MLCNQALGKEPFSELLLSMGDEEKFGFVIYGQTYRTPSAPHGQSFTLLLLWPVSYLLLSTNKFAIRLFFGCNVVVCQKMDRPRMLFVLTHQTYMALNHWLCLFVSFVALKTRILNFRTYIYVAIPLTFNPVKLLR